MTRRSADRVVQRLATLDAMGVELHTQAANAVAALLASASN